MAKQQERQFRSTDREGLELAYAAMAAARSGSQQTAPPAPKTESIWSHPRYEAADQARNDWLTRDCNDQMGALGAAVDAALAVQASAELALLREAYLQLEYLDSRHPTGTTPAVLARLRATLAAAGAFE